MGTPGVRNVYGEAWGWDVHRQIRDWAKLPPEYEKINPYYSRKNYEERKIILDPSLCIAKDRHHHPYAELAYWEPPTNNHWQVSNDGAYRQDDQGNPLSGTHGSALRKDDGYCYAYSYGSSPLHRGNLIHELISGKWGVHLGADKRRELNIKDLDVCMDSTTAISLIEELWVDGSNVLKSLRDSSLRGDPKTEVLRDIKKIVDESFGWRHMFFIPVVREANFLADNLTRMETSFDIPKRTVRSYGDDDFEDPYVQYYEERDYLSSQLYGQDATFIDNHYIDFETKNSPYDFVNDKLDYYHYANYGS